MFELEFEEAAMWTLFYRDLWGPVWPNLAASAVWAPAAFAWHHRRVKAHVDAAIQRQAAAVPQQVTVNLTGDMPSTGAVDQQLIRFMRQAGPGGNA